MNPATARRCTRTDKDHQVVSSTCPLCERRITASENSIYPSSGICPTRFATISLPWLESKCFRQPVATSAARTCPLTHHPYQIRRHISLPLLRLFSNSSRQRSHGRRAGRWQFPSQRRRRWRYLTGTQHSLTLVHCAGVRLQSRGERLGILPRVGRTLQPGCHTRHGADRLGRMDTSQSHLHIANSWIVGRVRCRGRSLPWRIERVDDSWRRHFRCARLM